MAKSGNDHGHKQQIDVIVTVGGEDISLRVNENAPIHTLFDQALDKSGNVGAEKERWQLFGPGSQPIRDLTAKIATLGLLSGSHLSMSLAAGAGGC